MIDKFTSDIVKIHFNDMGFFLSDIPYHLISDALMVSAFAPSIAGGEFQSMYPPDITQGYPELIQAYRDLCSWMDSELYEGLTNKDYKVDDVVYSYMLNKPIGPNSDPRDISYLASLTKDESLEGLTVFTPELALKCLEISTDWINKSPAQMRRPPSIFGEPDVIKSLRLADISVL